MPQGKLTDKQYKFVNEYLIDLNATQAAIRAGYSKNNADKIGPELLGKTRVQEYLNQRMKEREARTQITQDKVLQELAKIGFANMADYMKVGKDGDPFLDFSELTRDQTAALAEVTVEDFKDGRGEEARDVRRVKFKLHDKRASLVDIGKHIGMFDSKLNVNLNGKVQHSVDLSNLTDEELQTLYILRQKITPQE